MTGSTFPFTDGNVITAAGQNQSTGTIEEIYIGTGFDSSQAGSAATNSDNHELTAISAADLYDCLYIRIKIMAKHIVEALNSGTTATTKLKIEAKAVGGAYGDTMASTNFLLALEGESKNAEVVLVCDWVHTLTAGEKSAGVQFQITSDSVLSGGTPAGSLASVTNVQTIIERIHG